jgi:hypothetical protein
VAEGSCGLVPDLEMKGQKVVCGLFRDFETKWQKVEFEMKWQRKVTGYFQISK